MCEFNKIVLSRKGFDSAAGGGWSLFDPNSGKYIVLPIPADEKEEVPISNRLKYEDIKIKSNYLSGRDAHNLRELIGATQRWKPIIKRKGRLAEPSEHAHFDPWLGRCLWLEEESNHSIGAFGQVGAAQAHLQNQEVGKGSLFLFFTRFKPISKARKSMFGFRSDHLNGGLYFIYGWLRVGWKPIQKFEEIDNIDILNVKEKRELKNRHPHATEEYFKEYEKKNGKNTIYISKDFLGCGYFPKLTDELLLTATDSAQKPYGNWIASRWKLPPGFSYQTCRSVLKNLAKWKTTDIVETPPRWQEAVFDESEEFFDWFKGLLEGMHK